MTNKKTMAEKIKMADNQPRPLVATVKENLARAKETAIKIKAINSDPVAATLSNIKTESLAGSVSTLASVEKQLGITLRAVLKSGKAEDKRQASDIGLIALGVVDYIQAREIVADVAAKPEMGDIRRHCFTLIGYPSQDAQKRDIKSPAFEMRVTRGIRNALLAIGQFNPNTGMTGDEENGYQLNLEGTLTLPNNVLVPSLKVPVKDGEGTVEVPNPTTTRTEVPVNVATGHFGKMIPGAVTKRKSKTDDTKTPMSDQVSAVLEYVKGAVAGNVTMDVPENTVLLLSELEDSLGEFFTARTQYGEGGEIETTSETKLVKASEA